MDKDVEQRRAEIREEISEQTGVDDEYSRLKRVACDAV